MNNSEKYAEEIAWIIEYCKESSDPLGLRFNIDHFPAKGIKIVTSPQFPDFRAEISGESDEYYVFCEWLRGSGLMTTTDG